MLTVSDAEMACFGDAYGLLLVRKPKTATRTGHSPVQLVLMMIKNGSVAKGVQALAPNDWFGGVALLHFVK